MRDQFFHCPCIPVSDYHEFQSVGVADVVFAVRIVHDCPALDMSTDFQTAMPPRSWNHCQIWWAFSARIRCFTVVADIFSPSFRKNGQFTSRAGNGSTSGGRSLFSFLPAFATAASSFSLVNLAFASRTSALATVRTSSAAIRSSPQLLDDTCAGCFMPGRK